MVILINDSKNKVDKHSCVLPLSDYGVYPLKEGTPMKNCDKNVNCTFNTPSLSEAIKECNRNYCKAFMYNSTNSEMILIEPSIDSLKPSMAYDTYVSQTF